MAILIKRYANRKLYNTETSRYITLKGIAKLLDAGEEVRVIDKESGEDITQIALSQILVDNKRAKEDPSDTLLTQILSRGGDALYGAIKKSVDDASDGIGDFQDRFKQFVSQSEALARGERPFAWDQRTSNERRSPFGRGSNDDEPGAGESREHHSVRFPSEDETGDQSEEASSTRKSSSGWPRIGGFPDLRESIQGAVTQSVTQAVAEALDARGLARSSELETLNANLVRVAEAVERLESVLESAAAPNKKPDPEN